MAVQTIRSRSLFAHTLSLLFLQPDVGFHEMERSICAREDVGPLRNWIEEKNIAIAKLFLLVNPV